MREGVSTRLCSSTDVVPQHSTGYMYRRTIYLSDLPRALRRTSLSEKPGSLSDPHQLRAEKPGAGIDFHLPAQQTEPGGVGGGGGKEKTTSPMIRNHRQVNVAPEPGCYLIRMKRRSGWGGGGGGWGRREGALLFGGEKKKREMPRLSQDCRIPCWRMSARASHTLIVDSTKTTWQQRRRLNPGHRAVFM